MRSRLVFMSILITAAPIAVACSGGQSASGPSTSTLRVTASTSFVTRPTTPSTLPVTSLPGDTPAGPATYKVVAGDVRINVAKRFGVTLEALDAANATTAGYSAFYVGLEIQIPAGGVTNTTGAPETPVAPGTTLVAPSSTLPADSCAPGSYTILAEDTSRTKVASKFNITVEALDAANSSTSGYSAFYAGLKIVIPPKAGC